jgi:hypothetical protein
LKFPLANDQVETLGQKVVQRFNQCLTAFLVSIGDIHQYFITLHLVFNILFHRLCQRGITFFCAYDRIVSLD